MKPMVLFEESQISTVSSHDDQKQSMRESAETENISYISVNAQLAMVENQLLPLQKSAYWMTS